MGSQPELRNFLPQTRICYLRQGSRGIYWISQAGRDLPFGYSLSDSWEEGAGVAILVYSVFSHDYSACSMSKYEALVWENEYLERS